MEAQQSENIKKGMRTIWVIWISMLIALYAYVRVCHLLQSNVPYLFELNLPLGLIKYAFYGLSLIALIATVVMRKKMLTQNIGQPVEKYIQRAEGTNKSPIVMKYAEVVVVSIATVEAVGILGVIFYLLSGDFTTLYYFIGISAVAMIYFCPKDKELEKVSNLFVNIT